MPTPLDQVVLERLQHYEALPHVCQVHLDELGKMHAVSLSSALRIQAAEFGVKEVEIRRREAESWTWWQVTLVGVGSAVFGASVGILLR